MSGFNHLSKNNKHKRKKFFRLITQLSLVVATIFFIIYLFTPTPKSSEDLEFENQLTQVSLEGRVEEFSIEGRNHVAKNAPVNYKTNPPTSGDHFSQPQNWGVYSKPINDKAAIHALEHGGIWISYKDISSEEVNFLKTIAKNNPLSVVLSPRPANDVKISVVSWGRMMNLDSVDKLLIQKYINTYKNQSPEKLAK